MAKHVLSIEIGQQVTKVAEIDYKKKNPHVYKAIAFATPDDVMDDGFIRDRDQLAVAFRDQLGKAGIKEKSVVFTIASSKIATREIELPNVKANKLGTLIRATAQDHFPVDLKDYSLAYSVLDEEKGEKGQKTYKVQLLAAPDSLIENYYNFAQTMGYNIESIDYFGNGSMQVLSKEIVLSYCACIQIGGATSVINFMNEGQQLMQRTIPFGVFSIAQAIVDSEDNGINDINAACDVITKDRLLCRTLDYEGLTDSTDAARMTADQYSSGVEAQAIRKVATDACGDIIMSAVRVFDYFRSQYADAQLSSVYLTGMGVAVVGIDDLFASEIDVPIHKMEHLVNVTFPRNFTGGLYNQTEYIAVIGAAMKPVGFKSKNKEENAASVNMAAFWGVFAALVAVAVVLAAVSIIRYVNANNTNKELNAEKQSLASVQSVYDENSQIKDVETQINTLQQSTQTQNEYLHQLVDKLEDVLPTNTIVSSITADGTQISMTLTSGNDLSVARLLMNLKELPVLQNINVDSIAYNEDDKTWSYSLTTAYNTYDTFAGYFPATGSAVGSSGSAVSKSSDDSDAE